MAPPVATYVGSTSSPQAQTSAMSFQQVMSLPRSTSSGPVNGQSTAATPVGRPKSSGGLSNFTTTASEEEQKTAVKVAIRLRPPLSSSDPNYDLIPARFRRSSCQVPSPTTLAVDSSQGRKSFTFDRVFNESESQDDVWQYVSGGVDSFVEGYNVSLLAYGQSGAGKSYTMGTSEPGVQKSSGAIGIIPRAAATLFERLAGERPQSNGSSGIRQPKRYSGMPAMTSSSDAKDDKTWQLTATYVEIYNEQLRDLLVSESVPSSERPHVTIREDAKGKILLSGLKQVAINSVDDLMNALYFGSSIRQTDATAINSKSSRSHAIFSLNLVQKRPRSSADRRTSTSGELTNGADSWVTIDSKLHFVDLAGSERLKNSGLTGERVKEGISINAGLASLGKVIAQLSSRSTGSHVSYRDSRLTRMLQDSLGGNAITYMVACVNPVEFHLSETLNTVQYAQRARAIQTRPQIQQRSDDGDKQIIIDRLRSEVKFLRVQLRSSQHGDRRKNSANERSLRNTERENELQNQLLDIQENYSALSGRHAKLVSDMVKDKPEDVEKLPNFRGALESTSRDRLHRSSTFAEQVEHVILEYEKTIQSLEGSLSTSRSSLSTSESNLLEREAKIVYLEAMTQQLQSRVKKVTDREANGENHLRDLEAKLDSVMNGEEKQGIIIQDLRQELSRARQSESSAEDYISTLEERLAEAEQDTEVMQREIARLEQIIERQRSIGKLDNMLSELDSLNHDGEVRQTNGDLKSSYRQEDQPTDFFDQLVATARAPHPHEELSPENADQEWKDFGPMEGDDEVQSQFTSTSYGDTKAGRTESPRPPMPQTNGETGERVHSPAQAKAIADKLETMTMELFELRGDYDSTVAELDDVSRKYQIALSTLAELQDAVSPTSQRKHQSSTSFLDRGAILLQESTENGHHSSSHILSSDVSSRGPSPTLIGDSEAGTTPFSDATEFRNSHLLMPKERTLAESVRALRTANAEKDISINQLTENYAQLEDQHNDALRHMDELKEELSTQRSQTLTSQMTSPSQQNLTRRRSYMPTAGKDREGRVFASLQNLALEHLHSKPDAMRDFEATLGAAMTESQLQQERVETLEAQITTAKKELAHKNTMISGLSRERASRSATTTDVALVNTIKEHAMQTQQYIEKVLEQNREHQDRLSAGVQAFSAKLNRADTDETTPPSSTSKDADELSATTKDDGDVHDGEDLPKQLMNWHSTHLSSFDAVQALERQMMNTIAGLELSVRNAETLNAETPIAKHLRSVSTPSTDWEAEKQTLTKQVQQLEEELVESRGKTQVNADRVLAIEKGLELAKKRTRQDAKSREQSDIELRTMRDLVANLEDQLDQQKSLALFHQQGLQSAEEAHARQLDELKATFQAEQDGGAEAEQGSPSALHWRLTRAQAEISSLMSSISSALEEDVAPAELPTKLKTLTQERKELSTQHSAATEALTAMRVEMEDAKKTSRELKAQVGEMTSANEELLSQLDKNVEREQKNSRLVQKLEEQLNANYDQHKSVNYKLATAQKERMDVEKELAEHRSRAAMLESQIADYKRKSTTSQITTGHDSNGDDSESKRLSNQSNQLRKSNSQASLPFSPPPSVPLPPLPAVTETSTISQSPRRPMSPTTSPPPSRHSSRDMALIAQQQEFQLKTLTLRIENLDRKLSAEKTLTQTLEEALVDLETTHNKTKSDMSAWIERCSKLESESSGLRNERRAMRNSIQALQEETVRRKTAEEATKRLEAQMASLGGRSEARRRKGVAGTLNCF